MKRRDVIKLGVVAAGAGVGLPGCAVPKMLGSLEGPDGAAAFNGMLDEQLAERPGPGFLETWVAAERGKPLSPEARAKIAEKDVLFRRLIGTLLVTQGFRELPLETQLEPAVQARLWRHLDEVDATVNDVTTMLASLDSRQQDEVARTLKERPDLPMKLGEVLDGECARAGISASRRMQLRSMMRQTGFRLRNADPRAVIDETVAKVERVRESGVADAVALDLSTKLGQQVFWKYQHLLAQQEASQGGDPQPSSWANPQTAPPAKPKRAGNVLRVGLWLLGIGVVMFGVSVILVENVAFGFVIGITVGVILAAAGLITLLIGAIMAANES